MGVFCVVLLRENNRKNVVAHLKLGQIVYIDYFVVNVISHHSSYTLCDLL